jgi:hypothetical protein
MMQEKISSGVTKKNRQKQEQQEEKQEVQKQFVMSTS